MAHGWDSYFHNPPPLTSDPSTLRRTPESERCPSEDMDNFVGHHDFSRTVASHEATATNSNCNTNYFSNPSMGHSGTDCVYQKYYKETQWQTNVVQMEKDYLPNNELSDFATGELSTSAPFPSSFATDIQGLNQECGVRSTSFLESYSDVSSCSDADDGLSETRPSCKFVASSSFPKPKIGVAAKHNSSDPQFFPHTGNMTSPAESQCPDMSKTTIDFQSHSKVKTGEHTVQVAQEKTNSLDETIKCNSGEDQPSSPPDMVTVTGSETVEDGNKNGCPIQKQMDTFEQKQGNKSDKDIISSDNLTADKEEEYLDGHEEEQTTGSSPRCTTNFENEQSHLDDFTTEEIKQSLDQENVRCDNPDIKGNEVRDTRMDQHEESEVLTGESKESSLLEKEVFDEPASSHPNCTDGLDENMETSCQEKETESVTSPSLKSLDIKDLTEEERVCTSTLQNSPEPCLQNFAYQSCKTLQKDNDSRDSSVLGDDPSSHASYKDEETTESHSEVCSQSSTFSTKESPCQDTEMTSMAETSNTATSLNPDEISSDLISNSLIDVGDKNSPISNGKDSSIQSSAFSTKESPCQDTEGTSMAETSNTATSLNPDEISSDLISNSLIDVGDKSSPISNGKDSSIQSNNSNADMNSCYKKESVDVAERTITVPGPFYNHSLDQIPLEFAPTSHSDETTENSKGSLQEFDTSVDEPSEVIMLYGEPLSREESSCDTDETKLNVSQFKDLCVSRLDGDSVNDSEGQVPQLQTSTQMRIPLQPVVIMKTSEPINGMSHSFHCAQCQQGAHNVDSLIEHYHCYHLLDNFHYCKTCDLYLMRDEHAEKHICGVTKGTTSTESHQLTSKSIFKKTGKYKGKHKCIKCKLTFSRLLHYISHMRTHTGKTPYRCGGCGAYFAQSCSLRRHKQRSCKSNMPIIKVEKSDSAFSDAKPPPQKTVVKKDSSEKQLECYVKLVDISKNNACKICGKIFPTHRKATKHLYNTHKKKKKDTSLSSKCTKTLSVVSRKIVEDETGLKFKCPLCPRLFKYSFNRNRHLRKCVQEASYGGRGKFNGKYRCPLCKSGFTLASNRSRHLKSFCLNKYLSHLAKGIAVSKKNVDEKKTETEVVGKPKEKEKKMQAKEKEKKTLLVEKEDKKQVPPPTTANYYTCDLCPAFFYDYSGKYRHMKKHELFSLTGKVVKYRKSVVSTVSKPEDLSFPKTDESKEDLKSSEADSSLTLSCRFCEKKFSTLQLLKKHERNHKGERPYRCLECRKSFKRRSHLIGHKIVHQRRIQCTVCKKILPTIGELIQHRSTHLKRGMLKCPDCPQEFQYPAHLLKHVRTHIKREKTASQQEERLPVKPQPSVELVKDQSGPKKLQCSLCKEIFDDPQVLRKHCLTHISGTLPNQCPFCKNSFKDRRCLLRHMFRHTGITPQFSHELSPEVHTKNCKPASTGHHVAMNRDTTTRAYLKCDSCPRLFKDRVRLQNHRYGHMTNSLVLCSKCKKYFGKKRLKQHQKVCMGTAKPDPCFSSPNVSLNMSTSQDIQEMPPQSDATKKPEFKCLYCTETFRYRSLLLRHVVKHTGVQPYPCVHCGKRFPSRTSCSQHETFCDGAENKGQPDVKSGAATQSSSMPALREVAQKPKAESAAELKCKFCMKTFLKARYLRRHILTHNEVKPYRCRACDSCYSRYDHLIVHQARCRGKKRLLQVCIPKISLNDVGKGWQNKFGNDLTEKQETLECKICSRSFLNQFKLNRHNKLFHLPKLFNCSRCGSGFSHEKTLKYHRKMKKCRGPRKTQEVALPKVTNLSTENVAEPEHQVQNGILKRIQPHFKKKHKHVCSYCPRSFEGIQQLAFHTRLHTGERPYACDFCGMTFIRKDYVKRHLSKCTEKRKQNKVLCDGCGGFFSQAQLANHKKSCTSTRSSSDSKVSKSQQSASQNPPKGFSCAYCTSRFLLFSQLQEHFLNAHKMETMVPPVSTAPLQHHLSNIPNIKEEQMDESCYKGKSDSTNVICKLDTAFDMEEPDQYSCSKCDLTFSCKAGLASHQRAHSTEHPFTCKVCKKGFWNKKIYRSHYRKCIRGRNKGGSTTVQFEVPLKANTKFAHNDSDSVSPCKDAYKSSGTRVLQTSSSCREDSTDNYHKGLEESQRKEKKTVLYQCSECDESFADGLMLISHLEDHGRQEQEKKRNACSKCGKICSSQGNLQKHMKIHQDRSTTLTCPDCSVSFNSSTELDIHRTFHDPNRPYACRLCTQRFWTRMSLCSHYSEEHPNDVYKCRFCNKAYAVKKSLARHYKAWHRKELKDNESKMKYKSCNEKQSSSQLSATAESSEDEDQRSGDSDSDSAPYFPCHVCGKTFPTSESLEDHQRCHLGEKPHECEECGKCFFQASQLQQHQRMHKSEFQCQLCGRGFVSLFALRKHKHTHGKSRPYRCSKCYLSFTGPSQLAEHMYTHQEESFPCDICNRVFPSKISRAEHRKSHSNAGKFQPPSVSREENEKSVAVELKYRCGVCNERFRDPEVLSEHGCIASVERQYKCSDCDQHFLHASHLKKHRNTHISWSSSEYPCNYCNSSFSSSQDFLSHAKTHVNAGTEMDLNTDGFICPVCHQCFESATELISHFPVHPDTTFECKICKISFPSENELKRHEHTHLTSAAEFQCAECGQRILGRNAFFQHQCSPQQHRVEETEDSNPSAETPPPISHHTAGEEEEVDVTGEDVHECRICSMQFSSQSSLLEHENTQHTTSENRKPFKCDLCGKRFALRRYLRQHEKRHSEKFTTQKSDHGEEDKPKCSQCQIEFNTAEDLSLHMRLHAEKEGGEYRCDMCYKSFRQLSLLRQHQESHIGEVVYECTECDKAFAFPHLLEEHQQTHVESSQ